MQKVSPYYTYKHQNLGTHWLLTFVIPEPYHTLSAFPLAVSILQEHLPIIMECECDNGCYSSFRDEVPTTETGHLFEHILLEYLCQQKLSAGYDQAEFSGRTSWNWHKEKRGTFHISIPKLPQDDIFFAPALKQSLSLLQKILLSPSSQRVAAKQPRSAGLNQSMFSSVYPNADYVAV